MSNYETTDIILAAYLRVKGFDMVEIVMRVSKGTFLFTGVDTDTINAYSLGQLRVEPVAFNNMVKQLTTACRRMRTD